MNFVKNKLVLILAILGLGILAIKPVYHLIVKRAEVAEVDSSNGLPISGTFIMPDITYKSEAEYREFFQELKDSGINLVIFGQTSNLYKNCSNGRYIEEIDVRLKAGNPAFLPIAVRLAKEMGMTMYFDVAYYPISSCFEYYVGKTGDERTDRGRLLAMVSRAMPKLRQFVTKAGVDWNDPLIGGYYLAPEVDTRHLRDRNSAQFTFFIDLGNIVRRNDPGKKIMISPYQSEDVGQNESAEAFYNLLAFTEVDIVAPQDSIGTGLTKSLEKSREHFAGLSLAYNRYQNSQNSRNKEIWANVETFGRPGDDNYTFYRPAEFERVKNQIEVVRPYVSKIITWIYQHTMLSNPRSDNVASINQYAPLYTKENAELRKKLRADYINYYQGIRMYYHHTSSKSCRLTSSFYRDAGTCEKNLQIYLNGQTDNKCYADLDSCQAAVSARLEGTTKPEIKRPVLVMPRKLFYFHTPSKSCRSTSNTYVDYNLCDKNLGIYLPGSTSGKCYYNLDYCQLDNLGQ